MFIFVFFPLCNLYIQLNIFQYKNIISIQIKDLLGLTFSLSFTKYIAFVLIYFFRLCFFSQQWATCTYFTTIMYQIDVLLLLKDELVDNRSSTSFSLLSLKGSNYLFHRFFDELKTHVRNVSTSNFDNISTTALSFMSIKSYRMLFGDFQWRRNYQLIIMFFEAVDWWLSL